MSATTLHLRSEIKPQEERSALTPATTKALVNAGYKIKVERSPGRIFNDEEYEEAGATLVGIPFRFSIILLMCHERLPKGHGAQLPRNTS